jgi:hypothetical protein
MNINIIRYALFNLAFIFSASSIFAVELKSDDLNYTITVPDGWTVDFQSPDGFSIPSPDRKGSITLIVVNAKSGKFDSTQFEQELLKVGCQKVSSRNFTIDGVSAYETIQRVGKLHTHREVPFASLMVEHLIIANGRFYNLSYISDISGDATQASKMQERLASFHFLQPPKLSAGRFGSLGLKLAIPGVIIAGIVFMVLRSRKT